MNTQSIQTIPAVWMRGGTSKGIFLHTRHLPPMGPELDDLLLRIMGTPDPLQIDGVGGTTSSTSKAMLVGEADADGVIPYWFAQVGVDSPVVDWRGNCGNLTTAVAPFAIDEGLVRVPESFTGDVTVQLNNENTGERINALVQVTDGVAATDGDTRVAGVPGTGAAITTRYLDPEGTQTGRLLPLTAPMHLLRTDVGDYPVSLVDATNPYLFLSRSNVPGADQPVEQLRTDRDFLEHIESIRAAAAVELGIARNTEAARRDAPTSPRVVLVEPGEGQAHIHAITVSLQQVHRGIPMTGAMCLAAATTIEGTIPAMTMPAGISGAEVVIGHPLGTTTAVVEAAGGRILSAGVTRTARRLMRGEIFPRTVSLVRA